MKVISGTAFRGPAIGHPNDRPLFGYAWWEWLPMVSWMDWQIAGGRMRGIRMRWLCFFCDITHWEKP